MEEDEKYETKKSRLLDAMRVFICIGEELWRKLVEVSWLRKKYGDNCELMGDNWVRIFIGFRVYCLM